MKRCLLAILILLLSQQVFADGKIHSANDWSENWCQKHLEKAESLMAQPTNNPIKKTWRKIVLWDAKNAVKAQGVLAPSVASAEEFNKTLTDSIGTDTGFYYLLLQNAVSDAIRMSRPLYIPQTRYGIIHYPHIGETYTYEYTQYIPY
ncbi:MAG: hypothetical protein L6V95_09975 [Candidatus Melainabacteria bacterium]|nr:MAG: hypothetical protein L6V95_09975 [Candidatus Melainabacteria bacterium]